MDACREQYLIHTFSCSEVLMCQGCWITQPIFKEKNVKRSLWWNKIFKGYLCVYVFLSILTVKWDKSVVIFFNKYLFCSDYVKVAEFGNPFSKKLGVEKLLLQRYLFMCFKVFWVKWDKSVVTFFQKYLFCCDYVKVAEFGNPFSKNDEVGSGKIAFTEVLIYVF